MIFFFNDTATTEIYTLSLHDALPISAARSGSSAGCTRRASSSGVGTDAADRPPAGGPPALPPGPARSGRPLGLLRSEEHTSELQSRQYLVCRLLLEKKKIYSTSRPSH